MSMLLGSIHDNFSLRKNTISDLGAPSKNTFHEIFNMSLSTSSILFTIYCFYLQTNNNLTLISIVGFCFLYIAMMSMFLLGVYHVEKRHELHTTLAYIMFSFMFLGIIFCDITTMVIENADIYDIICMIFFIGLGVLFFFKRTPLLEWIFFTMIIITCFPYIIRWGVDK